jgi:acyl-coenzyme A thioesterase PaaI-like protein
MTKEVAVGERIRKQWDSLSGIPGGKWLFSLALGRMAPYTGTIGALVDELEPGYAKVLLKDRKKVRNHLHSIHAIALINLGEVTTGLATMSGMPSDARGILKGLSIEYHKKARGLLTAECRTEIPQTSERQVYEVEGKIFDTSGDCVATVTAHWLIGPMKAAAKENESSAA